MKYETILAMPDSKRKFLLLEKKLLKLQHYGEMFFTAMDEYKRLFKVYRLTTAEKLYDKKRRE